MSSANVGVDVGGTFTDLVAVAPDGTAIARKVLSTPDDQSVGVEAALRALGGAPVARLVHGTTVATNTLLERNGARVVLCATEGFTDILWLRRQARASLYDLAAHHPEPLVARDDVIRVPERIAPESVLLPLAPDAAIRVARAAAARAPDIVCVALLHAYRDPTHERALRDALRAEAPGVDVVLSSDVFPEIREYERTATTVAEGFLRPRVAHYLRSLAARMVAGGWPEPGVMTSSGGMRSAGEAAGSAARLALSGPAGGVVGAAAVARAAGISRALTLDIGGTSADVGLILDGEPLVEPGGEVAGTPIALPRVLVETVSAGGGSIAWIDDGGALRVGPRSAGAVPGPAAFGRGGRLPTVTDAHVVLGHIAEARMGVVSLDFAAARAALAPVAAALAVTVERLAHAMIATADAEMARALRRVSVERGVDPRGCTLVAFGGGGPLHACGVAERLGMTRVLVPPFAGVLSALGLAIAAERREAMQSVMRDAADLDVASLDGLAAALERSAGSVAGGRAAMLLRVRYRGQGHELDVPYVAGDDGPALADRFAAEHHARYGFVLDASVEVVSARVAVTGSPAPLVLRGDANATPLTGPASRALPDATLRVAADWRARPLDIGGYMLERAAT